MLNQQQLQQLKNEGYSESEISEAIGEVDREQRLKQAYAGAKTTNVDPRSLSQQTSFSYNPNDNLIKWQLEVNEILERAEHILREDEVKYEQGHMIWVKNTGTDRVLNDHGVKECMRIVSMYVNRGTILANYTADEVNDKVFDFGDRLNALFYTKYEMLGMDTAEKRKNFEMMWGMLVDIVHSAYTRSIGAGERGSLREARQLQQVEQINPYGVQVNNQAGGMQPQKRGIFNPMRYIAGKYKV